MHVHLVRCHATSIISLAIGDFSLIVAWKGELYLAISFPILRIEVDASAFETQVRVLLYGYDGA